MSLTVETSCIELRELFETFTPFQVVWYIPGTHSSLFLLLCSDFPALLLGLRLLWHTMFIKRDILFRVKIMWWNALVWAQLDIWRKPHLLTFRLNEEYLQDTPDIFDFCSDREWTKFPAAHSSGKHFGKWQKQCHYLTIQ